MLYVAASPYPSTPSDGIPVSEVGLSGLSFIIQNQADDYAELRFRDTWKGDPPSPFDVGREILFYEIVDGEYARLFRGSVDKPSSSATGTTSSKTVIVQGPWARFRRTPFLFSYPYLNGTQPSTHGILSGNMNSLLTTILNQNAQHIVQLGNIDVDDLSIPTTDIYNQYLDQVIKSLLRYVPDAIVSFDYSTDPLPTIHILSRPKCVHGVDGFGEGFTKELNVVPRYDRLIERVELQYEQTMNRKRGDFYEFQDGHGGSINTASHPRVIEPGFWICGTDQAGDPNSIHKFIKALKVDGYFDQTVYNWLVIRWKGTYCNSLDDIARPSNGVDYPVWPFYALYRIGGFMRLFSKNTDLNIKVSDDWQSYFIGGNRDFGTVSVTDRNYLSPGASSIPDTQYRPVIGNGPNWSSTPNEIRSVGFFPGTDASRVPAVFFDGNDSVKAMTCTINWIDFEQIRYPYGFRSFIAANILFAYDPGGDRPYWIFTKTVTNSEGGGTTGIASKLLSANNRLLYDASFTDTISDERTMEDVLRYFQHVRAISLSNYDYASTPVQRVRINWFSKTYSVELGAPEHLGPQDLIALAKAGEAL